MDDGSLLSGLDAEQRAAVVTPSTLVAVIAAAGSGKTRVLARRIAHRVATGSADARHTLALTFTRQAAGELRRRLRAAGMRERVEAGTFHSVALGILRQRWADEGRPAPTVSNDRHRLMSAVADKLPLDTLVAERSWSAARGVAPVEYVDAARAANRRCGLPPATVADALAAYEVIKRRRGVVDLDDLVLQLTRQLADDDVFAVAARWRFRHVLVDEAQDLNPVQYQLLRHLVAGRNDLFLVGDPAQAIYAFNGADPSLLLDVERHLPGVEVLHLTTNRRCTPQVVAAATHVLAVGAQRNEAVSGRPDGEAVAVEGAVDEHAEAALVAGIVARSAAGDGAVAVLARTHEQLSLLRSALERAGVRVRRQALQAGRPLATVLAGAAASTSAGQLRAWAHDVLEAQPPAVTIELSEQAQAERRVAAAALDYLREQPYGDGHGLRVWVATTSALTDADDQEGVELLTFHAAKGREWRTVVVTGVETGLVPHRSATTVDARAEEARLLHVALTRARDRLFVTFAQRRRGYARKPSPLIAGLPTDAVPIVAPPPSPSRAPDLFTRRTDSLRSWRQTAARASALLPVQICSDDDLVAIAACPPTSAEELARLGAFGPITAARAFAPIRAALDRVEGPSS